MNSVSKPFFVKLSLVLACLFLLQQGYSQEVELRSIEFQDENENWSTYNLENPEPIQGAFSMRIKIPDEIENESYILYLDELQEVSVYADSTLIGTTGVLTPLSSRNIPKGKIIQGIGNSVQERLGSLSSKKYIYLKGNNRFEKKVNPNFKLYSENDWQKEVLDQREKTLIIQGFIGGALAIITIYHLLIFFIRKDKPYLHYALYTGLIFFSMWNELGVGQLFFLKEYQFVHHFLEMSQMMPMFASLLYFFFMRSFIELDKLLPKLDRFIKWFLIVSVTYGLTLDTIYFFTLKRVWLIPGYFSALATLMTGLVSVILIFRTKNKLAYYFTLGSLVLYVAVFSNTILSILEFNGIIKDLSFDRMYITETGVMIEIIIFSLGLGYRMQFLEKEKQQVENLAKMKSRFFTNISHEFRTPLTVISGMVDQVSGNTIEKNLIKRNSKSLLKLVNQLLDLSKLDSGAMPVQMEQGDIISYLQYLTESFYSIANEKDVRLTFYTEIEKLSMDFDENKLQHIIYNLVGNAIKFTGAGGKVILHVSEPDKNQLHIKVKDTGKGMTEEEMSRVFDRFYQTENRGGSGVGLALTKELVTLLKGEIEVKSKLSVGSEFDVYLPIIKEAPYRQIDFQEVYPEKEILDLKQEHKLEEDKPIILIVEDNNDITSYLQSILSERSNVIYAKDGEEGLSMAQNHVPDIILSDVMMPKLGGFELCKILKSTETTSHIPVILLTAKHTQEDKISGLSTGADAYLTKPFERKELLLKIKNLLDLRAKIQSQYAATNSPVSLANEFLDKAKAYVEAHIAEPTLTVAKMSFDLGFSKMQVSRKLKALTGSTPAAFINDIRLAKAKELLSNESLSVSEVAYSVGFSDPSYFSKAFSKKFGFSPSQKTR